MIRWYPDAVALPFNGPDGGAFVEAPYRGILHTVEALTFNPSTSQYYGHRNPPHLTLARKDGKATFWQHYPFDRAARALENRAGGVQTNRQSAIQIEIAWRAAQINEMPGPMWSLLAEFIDWAAEELRILKICPQFGGVEQYGLGNIYEFPPDAWEIFRGWCGHQHVPENAHWDPGEISTENLDRLGLLVVPRID